MSNKQRQAKTTADPARDKRAGDGQQVHTKTAGERSQGVEHAPVLKGRTQKALKVGPHGTITHKDGSSDAQPSKHGKTDGTASLP